MGDVVLFSSLDLSIFFRVGALCRHHVCHVARQLAPGYFDGSRHVSFGEGRVFLCYDTTGSSDDKSLGGTWAILGMTLSRADISIRFSEKCLATMGALVA